MMLILEFLVKKVLFNLKITRRDLSPFSFCDSFRDPGREEIRMNLGLTVERIIMVIMLYEWNRTAVGHIHVLTSSYHVRKYNNNP